MRLTLDDGLMSPDFQVGNEVNPKFSKHVVGATVDRSEIVLFTAKGGIWFEYARYFREFLFKSETTSIYINEDK